MIQSVEQYRKKLSKELLSTKAVKKRLLGEFDKLVLNYSEDDPVPTIDTLTAAFGSAKDMAYTLMESVSAEEVAAYKKRCIINRAISITLVIAAFLFVIYVFFWMRKPLVIVDENKEICVNQLLCIMFTKYWR